MGLCNLAKGVRSNVQMGSENDRSRSVGLEHLVPADKVEESSQSTLG